MLSIRNALLALAVLALVVALFLFARGLTRYAYLVAIIVPIAAMSAIASQPGKTPRRE
jgi:hypothetical protein